MKKRIISLFLLVGLLLASCGQSGEPSETSGPSGDTTVSEEDTGEYKNPGVDYGGATFTILDYDTTEYFWQAATFSDINASEENGEPINDAQYARNIKVEELLNINLETHPVDGVKRDQNNVEFRKLVLAGDTSVDAGFIFGGNVDNIITEEGMVIDLNTITTLNTSASWWDQNAVDTFSHKGALNTITGDISFYTTFAPIHFFYNKDIAAANSLDNMYDMVRDGTWTWDKVFEYSTLVARDLNGDNKMDQNDMYGTALQGGLLYEGLISSGGNYAKKNAKGEIELVLNSERTVSVVEKIVPFLNDVKINSVANKYNSQYSNPYYEMHLPMFKNNQILFNWNQLLISFELRAMEADYGILPNPKFDEAQEGYHTPISLSWATMLCVPTTNNRLEMTGHVLDALGYYSQQMVTSEFIDTTVRHKSLRDDDSAEMLEIVLANKTWDVAQMYNWGGIHTEFYNLGYKNNINFASMWAKLESKVTEEMNKSLEMMG